MTRTQKLECIAGGAPYPIPVGMLAEAIASETTVEAFALAVADICVAARAVATEQDEIEALVARIIASDESVRGHTRPESDAAAIARRIANA